MVVFYDSYDYACINSQKMTWMTGKIISRWKKKIYITLICELLCAYWNKSKKEKFDMSKRAPFHCNTNISRYINMT